MPTPLRWVCILEHVETEKCWLIPVSGMPFCAMAGIRKTIPDQCTCRNFEHGVFIGAAGEGKIAFAARADYAAAAACVYQ